MFLLLFAFVYKDQTDVQTISRKQHQSLLKIICTVSVFSFSLSSRWHRSARRGPYALRSVSQQFPQGCPRNSANICLVEHRSFPTLEGGMSAASFLHSSFLQAISAVKLWLVHVHRVELFKRKQITVKRKKKKKKKGKIGQAETNPSSSAIDQPCLDPQSTCCQELGGAAQVFRHSPQLVGG